ncbi:hypothetical protein C2G38_2052689 [Gigaspora rosea]|uniref:Uncharacterized protein n=1 Tax=Gigaspora rosea TaxID=44941 RepID=A0A397W9F1_9GLOM|nr:hypothetical protein C2G38_2052689 [Gigaspora rosea]
MHSTIFNFPKKKYFPRKCQVPFKCMNIQSVYRCIGVYTNSVYTICIYNCIYVCSSNI